MTSKWLFAALTFAGVVATVEPARAQDAEVSRPLLVVETGVSWVGILPLPYADASVEAPISRTFGWGLNGGAGVGLGWLMSATGRFTSPRKHGTRFSAGLGPMVTTDGWLGTLAFATADATVEVRSGGGFVFVFGPKAAVALESAGVVTCGVDTCSGNHISRGDTLLMVRLGIGGDL